MDGIGVRGMEGHEYVGLFVGDCVGVNVGTLGGDVGSFVVGTDGDHVTSDGALVGDPGMIGESDGL